MLRRTGDRSLLFAAALTSPAAFPCRWRPDCSSLEARAVCRVCGGAAQRTHYSAVCCNACAQFFRRAVLQRRSYFCTRQNCDIAEADGTRRLCKSCRFTKCVQAGMVLDALWKRKLLADEDQFRDSALLHRLLCARQATFLNKISIMGKLAAKYNKRVELGACKPDLDQSELSKESEFEVLLLFMKQSAFEDAGLEPLDVVRVAGRVYYRWLFLSAVGVSLRNAGHQEAVCYFSDRGYLPITYADCCDFLARHRLQNVPVAAGFGFEMLRNGLQVARRFHAARLDRVEFAALTLLMILKDAKEMRPQCAQIDRQISRLFCELSDHHRANFSDVALRMGNFVLLLNDINEMKPQLHEFASILALSGYDVILPRLLKRYGLQ
ncbi:hypothetical protein M3Y99_00782300 [Aphelenchoides fujianensis]|nr:hypothetical protein M3Y99_00782300 [Aphelenchoides fujianensis]